MNGRAEPRHCVAEDHFKPCGAPSMPDSPIPVCIRHGAEFWRYLLEQACQRPWSSPTPVREPVGPEVVYYVQVGKLIKIGTSTNLRQRLKGYPANRRLLATEPGGELVERDRLQQFRALLHCGREWFLAGPELCDHIDRLRRKAGAPPIIRRHLATPRRAE